MMILYRELFYNSLEMNLSVIINGLWNLIQSWCQVFPTEQLHHDKLYCVHSKSGSFTTKLHDKLCYIAQ